MNKEEIKIELDKLRFAVDESLTMIHEHVNRIIKAFEKLESSLKDMGEV